MRRNLWWMMGPLRDGAGGDGADGGGGGTGFDPEAFKTSFKAEILGEVTKQLNGGLSRLEKTIKAMTGGGGSGGDGGGTGGNGGDGGDPGGGDPKPSTKEARELAKLRADLDAEKKSRIETESRAREANRISTLRSELAKHVDPKKLDAAVRIFGPDVRVLEDGSIVAGADESPVGEYLAEAIKQHEYLLLPVQTGGAGATAGNGRRGPAPLTMDQIKPGMSPEERTRAWDAIKSQLPNQ